MLTRPEVDEAEAEAKAEAEANSHEADAVICQNCLNFFSQILHFDPIFSKNRNFRSIFVQTSKISAQNEL